MAPRITLHGKDGDRTVSALQVLKVDVDVPIHLYDYRAIFEKRVEILKRMGYDVEEARLELSSSGQHVHYVIVLKTPLPSARDVYDLQLLLGDDYHRASFNYLRYRVMGDASLHFNVLFEKKMKLRRRDVWKAQLRRLLSRRHEGE